MPNKKNILIFFTDSEIIDNIIYYFVAQ